MGAGTTIALIKALAPKADPAVTEEAIKEKVDEWLDENITNPDSPPLDRSLSSDSAAAPADMVGDVNTVLDVRERKSKNLNITPYATRTDHGITFTPNSDNSIDVTNAMTSGGSYLLPSNSQNSAYRWKLPAGTYFLSGGISSKRCAILTLFETKETSTAFATYQDNGAGKKFTTESELWCLVGFAITDSNATGITLYLQVEEGEEATEYQSPFYTERYSKRLDDDEQDIIEIQTDLTTVQEDIEQLQGHEPGSTQYTGAKIVLEPHTEDVHKCDKQLWKEFVDTDLPSGATTEKIYHKNQAMTAYGGYMFFFSQDGGGAVVDIETKAIISTFEYSTPSNNHQNSAQFSSIFHTAGDEFPLLYISRCGNSNWSTGEHDNDEILVFRVTRVSDVFTFTLINSIRLDAISYGMSWGVDNVTHLLYAQAPIVSNFQYQTGNKIGFWVLKEPTKTDILSGTPIVLDPDDSLVYFETDYTTIQGCAVHHGMLYQGVTGNSKNKVIAYDVFKGLAVSTVEIVEGWEMQGVSVYNGKLYTTNKGSTALRVYEVEF